MILSAVVVGLILVIQADFVCVFSALVRSDRFFESYSDDSLSCCLFDPCNPSRFRVFFLVPESDRTDFLKAILMILSAVVVGLILVILVILLGMKFRKKEKSGKKPGETSIGDENRDEEFHLKDVGENYTALSAFDDEMCPDLIPEMRNTMEGARLFSTAATRWPCPQKDISDFHQISVRRQRDFEEEHVRPAMDCFIPQIATVHGFSPESSLRVRVLPHAPFLKQRDPGQLKELSFSEELNTTV
ncbi:uncharacterized protein LOC143232824 [Tachypleus tridentatus]|uniref:uncharacterized protein LOC143232824 n=1 Tax=Tachypleus tridentatus TaxID=6853 RepID=UPI003FD1956E